MTTFIHPDHLPFIERLAASQVSDTIRKRVRLLLLYEAGRKTAEIADEVDLSPGRVLYWRRRYLKDGLEVFGDAGEELKAEDGGDSGSEEQSAKSKKARRTALRKLIRRAKSAQKEGASTDRPLEELAAGLARAEKLRGKLKKRLKQLGKKKAARERRRLEKLDRRIKRAKKVLRKLGS